MPPASNEKLPPAKPTASIRARQAGHRVAYATPAEWVDRLAGAAVIDRLVHHAEIINLKGDSYRLKDRHLGRVPNDNTE